MVDVAEPNMGGATPNPTNTRVTVGIAAYAKAIVAFVVGALTVAFTALADGAVSTQEWVGILLGAFGTPAAVYAVPNKTSSVSTALTESAQLERGDVQLSTIVYVLAAIALVLAIILMVRAL